MKQKANFFNLELFRKTYNGPTVRVKLVVMEKTHPYLLDEDKNKDLAHHESGPVGNLYPAFTPGLLKTD